jgi:hypothetical protein
MLANTTRADCTPKAVSHRLNNIRKSGKPVATPSRGTPIKTPKSRAKKQKIVTPADESSGPEGLASSNDDDEVVSPSMNRKRARSTPKKSYAESDQEDGEDEEEVYIPFGRRIKAEPVERNDMFAGVEKDIQQEGLEEALEEV